MFPAGVRSPPLRGVDHPRARRPCGASPGITREGVFSEGRGLRARTARHDGLRKVSSMGEDRREAGCPTGTCLDQARAFLAGVRSPPLRGVDHPRARRPCGASPGITREVVFSEGRTLCVLLAWPNVCRGIPFSRDGRAKPGHPRKHASVKPVPSYPGVRSPPLRGEAKRRREGLTGANPEMTREVVFSEGRTLCVRVARPHASRGIPFPPDDEARGRLPNGDMSRSSRGPLCGRAEPAPPRGGPSEGKAASRGKPGDNARGGFLGGTHSVRPLSMAKRVPRDFVFTGWPGEAWSPTGICLGQAGALFAGVRSPPLREVDHPRARRPCGASQGITREVVFSEGRGLRARVARPDACRGILDHTTTFLCRCAKRASPGSHAGPRGCWE